MAEAQVSKLPPANIGNTLTGGYLCVPSLQWPLIWHPWALLQLLFHHFLFPSHVSVERLMFGKSESWTADKLHFNEILVASSLVVFRVFYFCLLQQRVKLDGKDPIRTVLVLLGSWALCDQLRSCPGIWGCCGTFPGDPPCFVCFPDQSLTDWATFPPPNVMFYFSGTFVSNQTFSCAASKMKPMLKGVCMEMIIVLKANTYW